MRKRVLWLALFMAMMIAAAALAESADYPDKVFDEPEYEYTVTEKEGMVIPVDWKGMPLQYIQHNYQTLTLASLAEFFHYSEPHLSTLIKQNTGKNFEKE